MALNNDIIIIKQNDKQFSNNNYSTNVLLFGYSLKNEKIEDIEYIPELIFLYDGQEKNKEENINFFNLIKDDKHMDEFYNDETSVIWNENYKDIGKFTKKKVFLMT